MYILLNFQNDDDEIERTSSFGCYSTNRCQIEIMIEKLAPLHRPHQRVQVVRGVFVRCNGNTNFPRTCKGITAFAHAQSG